MFKKSRRKISCGELFSVLENYCILDSSTVEFIESMDVETKRRRKDIFQEMSNFAHTYMKKIGNGGVSLDKNFYLICKGLECHISYNADPDLRLALHIENLDIVGSGEIILSWVGSISKFYFKNCRFIENGESNLFLRMNFVPKDDNISKTKMLKFIFKKNEFIDDRRDIHMALLHESCLGYACRMLFFVQLLFSIRSDWGLPRWIIRLRMAQPMRLSTC